MTPMGADENAIRDLDFGFHLRPSASSADGLFLPGPSPTVPRGADPLRAFFASLRLCVKLPPIGILSLPDTAFAERAHANRSREGRSGSIQVLFRRAFLEGRQFAIRNNICFV